MEKERFNISLLNDAVGQWLKLRKSQGIAKSTFERNRQSMNTIMSVLGKSIRLKSITTKSYRWIHRENVFEGGYKPQWYQY